MAILTVESLRAQIAYEPATGAMHWLVKPSRNILAGAFAGGANPRGYFKVKVGDRHYLHHRLAWFYMTGEWPTGFIDHIDGNPRNNAFANLRDVTARTNRQNMRRASVRNSCGFLGVSAEKQTGKFKAHINIDGVPKTLGRFDTPEEASRVYLQAKRLHHLGCTI